MDQYKTGDVIEHRLMPGFTMPVQETRECETDSNRSEPHLVADVDERWLPVVGYEGIYEVSNLGHIRGLVTHRRWKAGRVLKTPANAGGYQVVVLCKDRVRCTRYVHQLVMDTFAGAPEPGQEVRHLDGNPANNRWAPGDTEEEVRAAGGNLFYGTSGQNNLDQVLHGTHHWANVTHCPQKHKYTPGNTYTDSSGRRHCRQCERDRGERRRASRHKITDPDGNVDWLCGYDVQRPGQNLGWSR